MTATATVITSAIAAKSGVPVCGFLGWASLNGPRTVWPVPVLSAVYGTRHIAPVKRVARALPGNDPGTIHCRADQSVPNDLPAVVVSWWPPEDATHSY